MNSARCRAAVSLILLLLTTEASVLYSDERPLSERITAALKAEDWQTADQLLQIYIKEQPEKKWAYTSHAWALKNLKEYRRSADVARDGLKRWPDDPGLKKAAASALADAAMIVGEKDAIELLSSALQYHRQDYILYRLARKYRESGDFKKAIELLEAGAVEFPDYSYFGEALPITWYQYFKSARKTLSKDELIQFAEESSRHLKRNRPLHEQRGYLRVIEQSMRDVADRNVFEKIYAPLRADFANDPVFLDEYGFLLYAIFRAHGQKNESLRSEAISYRRRAYTAFWKKNPLPAAIKLNGPPLKGSQIIWSEFGGTAMTHNGLAHYCYDFASVDESGRHHSGTGEQLEEQYIFNSPVFAVADGRVSDVIDGNEDNPVGGYSAQANTVTLEHSGYSSFYVHLKKGTIRVTEGDSVKTGQVLAHVGNSGMSSEPHLHFCLYGEYDEGVSIPFLFPVSTIRRSDGTEEQSNRPLREDEIVNFR